MNSANSSNIAIDEKINQCQTQIEKTEVWKKGLLQQLFE
jgi:type I restriction enzyme S subunit